MTPQPLDPIVEEVRAMLLARQQVGFHKYGKNMDRTDIDLLGWLQHLQEELLDAALYIQRLKHEAHSTAEARRE